MPFDVTTALTWVTAGCSVIPIKNDGTKAPVGPWKAAQAIRAVPEVVTDYAKHHNGIAVVCGAISGNLEMFELEGRAIDEGLGQALRDACRDNGIEHILDTLMGGCLTQSPSGGYHLWYRVNGDPRRNTKLARRPSTDEELAEKPDEKIQVLIETRGEGGFAVVPPSGGTVHPTGRPWAFAQGSPATIPTITADERDALYAVATLLDATPVVDSPTETTRPRTAHDGTGKRPGDDYNERATWDDILTPHGWTKVRPLGKGYTWRRPGKTDLGISATTGQAAEADRLYVFTTSTEFESEKPYSKFAAYALLECGGDYSAAGRELRRRGFGEPYPSPVLSLVPPSNSRPPPQDAPRAQPVTDGTSAVAVEPAATPTEATLTDVGNAQLLVALYGEDIRYVARRGAWLRWGGHRWGWDHSGHVVELAKQSILSIDDKRSEAIAKHRIKSLSRRSIEAMVALARSDQAIAVDLGELDAHPYALCTPNGVVDLRTGRLNQPRPEDLHTRSTRYTIDPDCPTPKWNKFLEQTFAGNAELIGFVQRLAGYSATGLVTHHVLPFLHGPGGNGKSVFLDVLRAILGDYAGSAPAKFLMAASQQHETEIARLSGLRMVICSEVNQEDRFDEAKVKLLTGGDSLTARFLNQDHFDFTPTHHLWLMGNHQPRVSSGGESFWRRLRMVPFTNRISDADRVEGLAQLLLDQEAPGILAWIIAGAKEAIASGLNEPRIVMAATETYASEEDSVARFMADRCHIGGGHLVRLETSVFRKAYEEWCKTEGEKPVSAQALGRELRSRWAIESVRSNGRRYYTGMTLLADENEETVPDWRDR